MKRLRALLGRTEDHRARRPRLTLEPLEGRLLLNGTTIFVDADATGANNGSSWADAYVDFQDAPAAAGAPSGEILGLPQPQGAAPDMGVSQAGAAPMVTGHQPSGFQLTGIDHVMVDFDEEINATTFTVDDVGVMGPGGAVAATGVTHVGGNSFRIDFAEQSAPGTYTVTVGPDIEDLAGHPMDQDQDGTGGEPVEDVYTGDFEIRLIDTRQRGNAVVSLYDVAGAIDIDPNDILVRFGRHDRVRAIIMRGSEPMEGLGIAVSGAERVGRIRDARRGAPAHVEFIASDAPVRSVSLRSGISGYDLNDVEFGGFPAADVDGDGDHDDLTGLYAAAGVRRVVVRGPVTGELVATELVSLQLRGAPLNADVKVFEDAGTIRVINRGETAIAGDIDVYGNIRRVLSLGDMTGALRAGDGLGMLHVASELAGNVAVAGNVRAVKVRGDLSGTLSTTPGGGEAGNLGRLLLRRGRLEDSGAGAEIDISGSVNLIRVVNPRAAAIVGDVDVAGHLRRILSVGDVQGDIAVGDGLGLLRCRGMFTGNLDATGDLNRVRVVNPRANAILGSTIHVEGGGIKRLTAIGSLTQADVSASGGIDFVTVLGAFTDSSIEAQTLRRVRVRGAISDPTPGEPDVIHALLEESRFRLIEGGRREVISVDNNYVPFDGVDAFVGT